MLYRDQTFQSNPRAACSCSQPAQIFCWQQLLSPTGLTIGPCISLLSTPALRLAASTRACCSMAAISSRLHFDRSCIQGEENHKEGIQLYSLLLAPGRAAPWQPFPAVSTLTAAAFKGRRTTRKAFNFIACCLHQGVLLHGSHLQPSPF